MQHTFDSTNIAADAEKTAVAVHDVSLARRSNMPRRQRIAVVRSGISGVASAWLLSKQHDG